MLLARYLHRHAHTHKKDLFHNHRCIKVLYKKITTKHKKQQNTKDMHNTNNTLHRSKVTHFCNRGSLRATTCTHMHSGGQVSSNITYVVIRHVGTDHQRTCASCLWTSGHPNTWMSSRCQRPDSDSPQCCIVFPSNIQLQSLRFLPTSLLLELKIIFIHILIDYLVLSFFIWAC